jgi:hypothetical protein
VVVAAILGSFLGASTVDVTACGDKFLRIGRSPRHTYAALHSASILLYVPKASGSDVKDWEKALKRAGHRALAVRDADKLPGALAGGRYDILITSFAEATRVRALVENGATRPSLLPVVPGKELKNARAQIEREFPHHLEDGANALEVYKEIDRVMELRLGNLP